MKGNVDLHTHSSASDGKLSPRALVKLARKIGLEAVAVTDHDTLSGIKEAGEAGLLFGVEVVPGVEISAEIHGTEVHILGYYPRKASELEEALREMRDERAGRMTVMLHKLGEMSIKVTPEDVKGESGDAAPGRLHLARVLLRKGYVSSINEAFHLYLDPGKPVYAPRRRPAAPEAIALIKRAGGIPVLAHPAETVRVGWMEELEEDGLMGIEVFHPKHSRENQSMLFRWASRKGLLITGGSDFHGGYAPGETSLGHIKITYRYLERLKDAVKDTF